MATHHGTWKRLGDGSLLTEDADEGLGHVVDTSVYLKILLTLMFLTVVTVAAATQDFGVLNTPIALTIATIKAALVMSFFMHLKFERKMIFVLAVYPLIILVLMMLGTVGDRIYKDEPVPYDVLNSKHTANEVGATH